VTDNADHYYPEVASRFLPQARTISVWLPPGYGSEPHCVYPALYLHDGQNLFDADTAFGGVPWGVAEVAEREVREGRVEPLIMVGVANTPDRLEEYGPTQAAFGTERDLSRDYGRFLVEELKPFIDATYHTRPEPEHTGVGGSSMGGLISLHLCQWYPGVFGKCAAMSPSLWWDREYFLRDAKRSRGRLNRGRVWLDVGEHEVDTPEASEATVIRARQLAALFAKWGMREGEDYRYLEVPGGTHNEAAWGARFDEVLRFLFASHD
jgi:predicted alpha/beta superfamily hydrolase